MIKCGNDCHAVCDFCIFVYKIVDPEYNICLGEAICKLTKKETDLCSYCNDFFCFRVDAREAYFSGKITAEEYSKYVLRGERGFDNDLLASEIKIRKLQKYIKKILNGMDHNNIY